MYPTVQDIITGALMAGAVSGSDANLLGMSSPTSELRVPTLVVDAVIPVLRP